MNPAAESALYAVEQFARRCLDDPMLDDHPAPVISRELERVRAELQPEPVVKVEVVKPKARRGKCVATR